MRITDVRLSRLHGAIPAEMAATEERQVGALDLFAEYRARTVTPRADDAAPVPVSELYLEIDTDEDITGIFGPLYLSQAFLIDTSLRQYLIGRDPLATERLWDLMIRHDRHARRGALTMAISAVDIALWDIRGKAAGMPIYRLLGGPTRDAVPAYASMLGHALEPDKVRERALQKKAEGYQAQKWFFRYGPGDGPQALIWNMDLVRTVREAVGDDTDIMFDAWLGWDVPFSIEMGLQMRPFRPRWLEEPVQPDRIESYARIRRETGIPISGGEHEYTRWGFKVMLDADALDVIQADPDWTGGISELVKICNLCSAYDKPVIPHGHSVLPALHVIASQSPATCPMLEYLVIYNPAKQWFHDRLVQPIGGMVALPQEPGLGLILDEAKIVKREPLSWR